MSFCGMKIFKAQKTQFHTCDQKSLYYNVKTNCIFVTRNIIAYDIQVHAFRVEKLLKYTFTSAITCMEKRISTEA